LRAVRQQQGRLVLHVPRFTTTSAGASLLRVICGVRFFSVLPTFKITAACDEFPATRGEGVRRVTVAPQHRKASSADAVRRCTQNTLMFPRGSKTVAHAFDIDRQALPASSHRRSRGPVPIRVFCVHRLAASALKFLLCGAAGRCWRTHCQARVAANASAATPWHCACMAPRVGCGQRLRCVLGVKSLLACFGQNAHG
jgi:hypothetical protein